MSIQFGKARFLDRAAEECVLDDGHGSSDASETGAEFRKMLNVHPAVFDDDEER